MNGVERASAGAPVRKRILVLALGGALLLSSLAMPWYSASSLAVFRISRQAFQQLLGPYEIWDVRPALGWAIGVIGVVALLTAATELCGRTMPRRSRVVLAAVLAGTVIYLAALAASPPTYLTGRSHELGGYFVSFPLANRVGIFVAVLGAVLAAGGLLTGLWRRRTPAPNPASA